MPSNEVNSDLIPQTLFNHLSLVSVSDLYPSHGHSTSPNLPIQNPPMNLQNPYSSPSIYPPHHLLPISQSMNITPSQTTCVSSNPSPDAHAPPTAHFGCKDSNGNNIGQSASSNNHDGYMPNMPITKGSLALMGSNAGSKYSFHPSKLRISTEFNETL